MRLSDMVAASTAWQEQKEIAAPTAGRLMTDVFVEEPVPLTTFVQDQKYLANPPLSQVQYEAVRVVEQIYYPELYPAMAEEFGDYWAPERMVNFVTLQWGKGSGKDHICRISSLRVAYLLLCLRSPQSYYEMPAQDTIHLLNVAWSSSQAQQAFFIPMKRAVRRGWFADRALAKLNVITFDKGVEAISGHSDAESQEGLNLMLGIADEIDAFKAKDEMTRTLGGQREPAKSSDTILNMMRTSASTRFPRVFKNIRISYPRYLGSPIQRLTDQARRDNDSKGLEHSRHYVSGPLATWEVNPRVPGKEAFAEDYEEDPVMARAKYECEPSRAIRPYFRNEDALLAMFVPQPVQLVSVSYTATQSATSSHSFWRWDADLTLATELVPKAGAIYYLSADLGIRKDRCGIAMSHVKEWVETDRVIVDEEGGEDTITDYSPVVETDFTFSFEADLSATPVAREIQIRWVQELVHKLRQRGFVISGISFDSYQSTESIQRLKDVGIEAENRSTDRTPEIYQTVRDLAYMGRVTVPWSELLFGELSALQRMPSGKLDHPPAGSKDIADAWACSIQGAVELGGQVELPEEQVYPGDDDIEVLAWGDFGGLSPFESATLWT